MSKQRLLSILLCLCMVLSLLPVQVLAAETSGGSSQGEENPVSVLSWTWDDPEEYLSDGVLYIVNPGDGAQLTLEALTAMLPAFLTAQTAEGDAALDIAGWDCPDFAPDGETGLWPTSGSFVFTPQLPGGYAFDQAPAVTAVLGGGEDAPSLFAAPADCPIQVLSGYCTYQADTKVLSLGNGSGDPPDNTIFSRPGREYEECYIQTPSSSGTLRLNGLRLHNGAIWGISRGDEIVLLGDSENFLDQDGLYLNLSGSGSLQLGKEEDAGTVKNYGRYIISGGKVTIYGQVNPPYLWADKNPFVIKGGETAIITEGISAIGSISDDDGDSSKALIRGGVLRVTAPGQHVSECALEMTGGSLYVGEETILHAGSGKTVALLGGSCDMDETAKVTAAEDSCYIQLVPGDFPGVSDLTCPRIVPTAEHVYTVYGDVTLPENCTLAVGDTLVVPSGSTLRTASNKTLNNLGKVQVEEGGSCMAALTTPLDEEVTPAPQSRFFTVSGGTENTDYRFTADTLELLSSTAMTVTSNPAADGDKVRKILVSGDNVRVTLDGIKSTVDEGAPLTIAEGKTAAVTIRNCSFVSKKGMGLNDLGHLTLTLEGDNAITAGDFGFAGLQTLEGSSVTIVGTGSVTVTGSPGGAGIGGNRTKDVAMAYYNDAPMNGTITISGGNVTAIATGLPTAESGNTYETARLGNGAGIGQGALGSNCTSMGGAITINGTANVTAEAVRGAGIGCGVVYGTGGTAHPEAKYGFSVNIEGNSVVKATSQLGCGIGGAGKNATAKITIQGNAQVDATGTVGVGASDISGLYTRWASNTNLTLDGWIILAGLTIKGDARVTATSTNPERYDGAGVAEAEPLNSSLKDFFTNDSGMVFSLTIADSPVIISNGFLTGHRDKTGSADIYGRRVSTGGGLLLNSKTKTATFMSADTDFCPGDGGASTVTIKSGKSLVIPAGYTLTIPADCELIIEQGASFVNNGNPIVYGQAAGRADGKLTDRNSTGSGSAQLLTAFALNCRPAAVVTCGQSYPQNNGWLKPAGMTGGSVTGFGQDSVRFSGSVTKEDSGENLLSQLESGTLTSGDYTYTLTVTAGKGFTFSPQLAGSADGGVRAVSGDGKTLTYTWPLRVAGTLTLPEFTVKHSTMTYTGESLECGVTPPDGSGLVEGTDYTVQYINNTKPGLATVFISGKGRYVGTRTLQFTITAVGTQATLSFNETSYSKPYTGAGVTLSAADLTLTAGGEPYTNPSVRIEYQINGQWTDTAPVARGTYRVRAILEDSRYSANEPEVSLTVTQANLSETTLFLDGKIYYSIQGIEQEVLGSILYQDRLLKEDVDYTLSGATTFTGVGTYTVTASGMGNFTGTVSATYEVQDAAGTGGLDINTSIRAGNPRILCNRKGLLERLEEIELGLYYRDIFVPITQENATITVSGNPEDSSLPGTYTLAIKTRILGNNSLGNPKSCLVTVDVSPVPCNVTLPEDLELSATPLGERDVSAGEIEMDQLIEGDTVDSLLDETGARYAFDEDGNVILDLESPYYTFTSAPIVPDRSGITQETLECAISEEPDGENGWYTVDSTAAVKIPDSLSKGFGYAYIRLGTEGEFLKDQAVLPGHADKEEPVRVFLATSAAGGNVIEAKPVYYQKDGTTPQLGENPATVPSDTSCVITLDASWGESGAVFYYCTGEQTSADEIKTSGTALPAVAGPHEGAYSLTIPDLSLSTEYTISLALYSGSGVPAAEVRTVTFTTTKASLAKTRVTLEEGPYHYSSTGTQPAVVSVLYGETEVDANQYDLSWESNTAVGTGYAILTAKANGSYVGEIKVPFTIDPKPIVAAVDGGIAKSYDGLETCTVNLKAVDGGETVTGTADATFASPNAGEEISVTLSNLRSDNDNYTFTAPQGLTGNIAPATIAVTGATAESRAYLPENTAATVTGVTFDGLVEGETLALGTDFTAAGAFETADVGEDKEVTVTVALGETQAAKNYQFEEDGNTTVAAASITAVTLQDVQWPAASAIEYGQPLSDAGLTGGDERGDFAWTEPAAKPEAGRHSYSVTFTPADANYAPQEQDVSVTVNQAQPRIAEAPAAELHYGQTLADAAFTGGRVVNPHDNSEVPGSWSWEDETAQPMESGKANAVFTPTDTENYTDSTEKELDVTVNAGAPAISLSVPNQQLVGRSVTVTAAVLNAYDEDLTDGLPEISLSYKLGGSDQETPITGGSFTIPAETPAGPITIIARTEAVEGKYIAGEETAAMNAVEKYDVSQQLSVAVSPVTYGQAPSPAGSFSGDAVGTAAWTYTYSTDDGRTYTDAVPRDAGTYRVKAAYSDEENQGEATAEFTIRKAPLTVTSAPHTISYGDALSAPSGALTYRGFQYEDDETAVDCTMLSYESDDYDQYDSVGTYTLKAAGLQADNYTFTCETAVLTVAPRAVTLVWQNTAGRTYRDGKTVAAEAQGLVNGDSCLVTVIGGEAGGAGNYTATATALSNRNYKLPETGLTQDYTVGKAAAPVVPSQQVSRKYSDLGAATLSLAGLVPDDAGETVYTAGTPNGAVSRFEVSAAGEVTFALSGGSVGDTVTLPVLVSTHNYEDFTVNILVTLTDRENQNAPGAFTLNLTLNGDGETYTAELPAGEGREYSFDGMNWSHVNTRTDVAPGETVTGYVRMAETDDANASPAVSDTATAPLLKVAAPVIDPPGGRFSAGQTVTITCATAGAVIYYTTDGSDPAAGAAYTGPFSLAQAGTVRAVAKKPGMVDSAIASAHFSSGGPSSGTNRPQVEVAGEGGKVTTEDGAVTIIPDEGFEIGKVTVNGQEVEIPEDGKLTGLTGTDRVVVTFVKTPSVDMSRYTDLDPNAWYYDSVVYVVQRGILHGTSSTKFSPDLPMTRAMFMTVLARLDGQDTTAPSGGNWYDAGMSWAMEQGISDGTNPDDSISREQLATMLYRYAGSPAVPNLPLDFTDAGQISGYAQDAMRWAIGEGIVEGKGGGILDPKGPATRAQVAAMLMRYLKG